MINRVIVSYPTEKNNFQQNTSRFTDVSLIHADGNSFEYTLLRKCKSWQVFLSRPVFITNWIINSASCTLYYSLCTIVPKNGDVTSTTSKCNLNIITRIPLISVLAIISECLRARHVLMLSILIFRSDCLRIDSILSIVIWKFNRQKMSCTFIVNAYCTDGKNTF